MEEKKEPADAKRKEISKQAKKPGGEGSDHAKESI